MERKRFMEVAKVRDLMGRIWEIPTQNIVVGNKLQWIVVWKGFPLCVVSSDPPELEIMIAIEEAGLFGPDSGYEKIGGQNVSDILESWEWRVEIVSEILAGTVRNRLELVDFTGGER